MGLFKSKEEKEKEKKRKKEIFDKIMASNPEVSKKSNRDIKNEDIVCCPKCGSTQLTANKKGFGVGKALGGALLAGPIGLAAGGIGSGKVLITCLKCGKQFKPGK